jgi:CheY-like chemotaxis protein
VLEDNAVNRMLIVTYLDEFGLTHEVVTSGDAAVTNLASKDGYDLVLMDTAMRDLDVADVTRRIRNLHAPSSQVPIVGLVTQGMISDCGAYAAGMDAYVSKPIRGRELYATLAPFLGGAKEEPVLRLVKG